MDFIKNLKISDDKDDVPQQNIATTAPSAAPQKKNLFDKITDALDGDDDKATKPLPVSAPVQKKEEESLFNRIGDKISGRKTPPPPPPPAKAENIFDKIGSALGRPPTPPPAPEKTDLFSKITDTLSGRKDESAKPQSLGDKINHALGGGAKGEAEEGKLDKAIDLFQEHVLKEGPQHNESALEQAKDNQIANTLRKTFGLPAEKERN